MGHGASGLANRREEWGMPDGRESDGTRQLTGPGDVCLALFRCAIHVSRNAAEDATFLELPELIQPTHR